MGGHATMKTMDFAIGDKVMFTDDFSEWYVLALYPSIEHLVCITTKEDRKDRRTFKPHQLEILEGMP